MGPEIEPAITDAAQPARADVVIIGGGIIGISAALFLARQGVSVVLCEKGRLAGEQSSRNWGWVRKTGRDLREVPLIIEALRMWEELEREGIDTGFRRCGVLYVGESDADLARYQAWLDRVEGFQMGSRLIEGAELAAHLPGATRRYRGALYTATDGRAEPQKAVPAIAAAARQAGAIILEDCAVRGIERRGGRLSTIVTERGPIACESAILAGGAWSRLFCASLGIRLPQLKVRATVLRTGPIAGGPETSAWLGQFAYRKRLDGGYTIANGRSNVVPIVPDTFRFFREFLPAAREERRGLRLRLDHRFFEEALTPKRWALDKPSPFENQRILDPDPVPAINAAAARSIAEVFPIFRSMTIAQQWAGMIDVTPDVVPVISEAANLPGFVIATGFSGHGFGIGPAAGRLAAEIATGRPPIVDPTPFRYSRFTDGTPITIQSGL
ncbi:NAD(P)/FAD-dependent oxidoreductase [Acidisoma sp. C75]